MEFPRAPTGGDGTVKFVELFAGIGVDIAFPKSRILPITTWR